MTFHLVPDRKQGPDIRYMARQPKLVFLCTAIKVVPSSGRLNIQSAPVQSAHLAVSSSSVNCVSTITPSQALSTHSFLSRVWLPPASQIPYQLKPFTASNHSNPVLPLPWWPSTLAALTFHGQRTSSFLSEFPNHRNIFLSTFSARVFSILALIKISSFLTLFHQATSTISLRRFISYTFKRPLSASLRPPVS